MAGIDGEDSSLAKCVSTSLTREVSVHAASDDIVPLPCGIESKPGDRLRSASAVFRTDWFEYTDQLASGRTEANRNSIPRAIIGDFWQPLVARLITMKAVRGVES